MTTLNNHSVLAFAQWLKHVIRIAAPLGAAAIAVSQSVTTATAEEAFCQQLQALLQMSDFRALTTSKIISRFNEIEASRAKETLTGYTDCRTFDIKEKGILKETGYICRAPYFHPNDKESNKMTQDEYGVAVDAANNQLVDRLKPCLKDWDFAGDRDKHYSNYEAFTKGDLIIGYARTAPGYGYKESNQLTISVTRKFGKFVYER